MSLLKEMESAPMVLIDVTEENVPAVAAAHGEHVGAAIEPGQVVVGHPAEEAGGGAGVASDSLEPGPVAPVTRVSTAEDAVRLAAESDYGLSLGIVTRDVMRGLALAEQIPTGIVHINDQTVNDEANAPFGGTGASGTGSRFGGAQANIDAFTDTRWLTVRSQPAAFPF